MKRLLTTGALFLCSLLTFAQGSLSGTGDGTEDNPYKIFNADQLSQVANFLNQEGVVFKLMNNLDLTDWIDENNPNQGWLPIGVETSPFKGKFYGNGKIITGLRINRTSTNNVGFFGYVTNANISDLTIEGTTVTGAENVGALVGFISGSTVSNCHVKLEGGNGVTGTTPVGGLAGYSSNTSFQTFSVTAIVSGSQGRVGGIVGKAENSGTLSDGSFLGEVSGIGNNTGGLIGIAIGQTFTNLTVKATIIGDNDTGGIAGSIQNGVLSNCIFEGSLSGSKYVGGIVGELLNTTSSFTSCFSKGKITATGDYAGGIVGVSQGACIEEMEGCSHFGDISGQSYVGGLVGAVLNVDQPPTLHTYESRNYYNNTHVNWYYETINTGGGRSYSNNLNNCTAIGNIIGGTYIGGLIGSEIPNYRYTANANTINDKFSWSTDIHYCSVYKNGEKVGYSPYTYFTYTRNTISLSLTNNYYSGTLQGTDNVGGLVGYKSGGTIQNNYAYANIYGSSNVGGIVGQIHVIPELGYSNTTTLKSNASINGIVSANASAVGRIYGYTDNNEYTIIGALGSAEGNRALVQTKVILQGVVQEVEDDLQNGTSAGPTALRYKANYVSWGWNFDENWNILETECYPYKKYQAAPPVIKSNLVSQATSISGQSLNGGTVYLYYKDRDAISTTCDGNNWTYETEPLQSGALVQIYADVEGMTPSYFTTTTVGYPGSGTEDDPYRIYTAEDLQGASNRGYYKLMNDIDLTTWINENSPTEGWPAIGRNSGEATYIDGAGHKVTGLWMNTTQNYNGLFSNFSAGQIKNLTVEVAAGKKVKGGDYTGILIGRNANGRLVNCTVKGEVEGTGYVGGLVGYVENTTISAITTDATITGTSCVGGVAGHALNCTMTLCNAATTITSSGANSKVGGLVGYAKGGSISRCTAQNNLTAADESNYVGGLVGYSETPITRSFSTGSSAATGSDSYSGGLVGYATSPIENCYSTANTTGTLYTAGLVGYTFSTIDKCYAKGDVYGEFNGGGVVGYLDGAGASLTNSFACCNILSLTSQLSWGCRVIGGYKNGAADPDQSNYALSTMQVSLNNVPQVKKDDLVEGIAKTEAELMQKVTYQSMDWDFDNVWEIEEGTSYPYQTVKVDGGSDPTNPNDPSNPDDPQREIEVTDISTMSNVIYIDPMEEMSGSQATISVKMKNAAAIRGFQFDLYLPEGVTVVKSSKGKIQGFLSAGRLPDEDEHSLTFSEQADGAIRFLCNSQYDETFTGNDGEIATLRVNISEEMADGDYLLQLKKVKLTETDISKFYWTELVKSKLTIKSYTLGDINSDGTVDVSDYTGVANHIHGNTPEGFVFKAGDVDESGTIDISDYTGIANIIHTGSIYGNSGSRALSRSPKKVNTDVSDNNNVIYVEPFAVTPGTQTTISFKMKNTAEIRGFQFDLYLPEGVTVVKSAKGRIQGALNADRLPEDDEHDLTFSEQPDGAIRFLCSSQYDETFTGNDGEIATLTINVAENVIVGDYPIYLRNMKLTETDIARFYETKEIETTVTITGSSDSRVQLDEASTDGPVAASNVDVRVIRTIAADRWSTICLPFAMTEVQVKTAFGEDVELGDFAGYELLDNGNAIKVNFNAVTAIAANHPYIIKVKNKVEQFTVDGVDIDPKEEPMVNFGTSRRPKAMVGTYINGTKIGNGCLFLNGNNFWYSTGETKMKGFRAYFDFYDLLPNFEENYAESRIILSYNGEPTGISDIVSQMGEDKVYNLNGQRVSKAGRGVYIVNGKKVVKK